MPNDLNGESMERRMSGLSNIVAVNVEYVISAVPRLQKGVPCDDRIPPALCSEVRVQLQLLDFTETYRQA